MYNYSKTAVALTLNADGGGKISVNNPSEVTVVSIQSNKKNEGGVYVSDVNGNVRASLQVP